MNNFDEKKYINDFCTKIKKKIYEKIVISVSGGIDSTTSAALLKKSGVDYEVLLMNTGYLRKNEIREVKLMFKKLQYDLKILDKKKEFYSALRGISDPKTKRHVFREKYFEIFSNYLIENNIRYIAQGTQFWNNQSKIYHNCPTEKFNKQKLHVIEPVNGLSKNYIKKLAKKLELPEEVVNRRPFPGPGLLIRFGGDFNLKKLKTIQEATFIVDKFVEAHKKSFNDCYQIFPYLSNCTPVTYIDKKSEGSLGQIIVIRAVKQKIKDDTIEYVPFVLNKDLTDKLVEKLMELKGIGRVCFDMTPKLGFGSNVKSGATIEYI